MNLGPLWSKLGALDRARDALETCLALCREIGARYPEGYALRALADVAEAEGDHAAALELASQGLALRRETGHGDGVADSLIQVAHAPEEYRASMIEKVPLHRDITKAWEA